MTARRPVVTSLVHLESAHVDGTQACVAAVVTDVGEHDAVALALFPPPTVAEYPSDPWARHEAPRDGRRPALGTWHWVEED